VHEWDTFAVIVGGSAGALVGLLFVAISIHAGRITESADLRGRAAQTLVIFAALLLIALLLAIPEQSQRVLGVEFLVLAVLVAVALILLDRLARNTDSPRGVASTVKTSIHRRLPRSVSRLQVGSWWPASTGQTSSWSRSSARRWSAGWPVPTCF
jgi:hypothetical protein